MEMIDQQSNDVIFNIVIKELKEVKRKITSLENKTFLEELKISDEDLEAIGIFRKISKKIKRCPIAESKIREAQQHCDTATDCAKYLKVCYSSYKKWAKKYDLFKIKPWGKGDKKRYWIPDKGKHPLNQILAGKFPEYSVFRLRDLLIKSGMKEDKCENCGFSEGRITDNKMPLLISFKDNDERNHLLENIEILCYNCMFLIGKGYVSKDKLEFFNII